MGVSVFDIGGLLSRLEELTDARSPKGLHYALAPVLPLIILAKLSGEDKPYGMSFAKLSTFAGGACLTTIQLGVLWSRWLCQRNWTVYWVNSFRVYLASVKAC